MIIDHLSDCRGLAGAFSRITISQISLQLNYAIIWEWNCLRFVTHLRDDLEAFDLSVHCHALTCSHYNGTKLCNEPFIVSGLANIFAHRQNLGIHSSEDFCTLMRLPAITVTLQLVRLLNNITLPGFITVAHSVGSVV
jgi:hypothetical protein